MKVVHRLVYDLRRFAKLFALLLADSVSTILPFRSRRLDAPEAIYVLMLRPLGLGDLMMLSPFVIDVARRFVGIPTYLVTDNSKFMELEGVIWLKPSDLSLRRRSVSLVLSPTFSWKHARFLWGAKWFLGYFLSNRLISNFTRQHHSYDAQYSHYFDRAKQLLSALGPRLLDSAILRYGTLCSSAPMGAENLTDYVCVAPYSNWEARQYPKDFYKVVISSLAPMYQVVLVGGNHPDELGMAEELCGRNVVNLVGRRDLPQVVEIIKGARLFIGNDSGLAHAAFLTRTTSIVVFGCVNGSQRLPIDPALSNQVVALGAGARCQFFPCYDGYNTPRCKNKDRHICLRGVSPHDLIDHAIRLLGSSGIHSATKG
jgi:ADP-heptose:LPS heptosyltransferase